MNNQDDYKPKHIILHGTAGGTDISKIDQAAAPVEEEGDRLLVNITPTRRTLYDLQMIVNRLARFGSWQVDLYCGQLSISTYTNRIDREAQEVEEYLNGLPKILTYTLEKMLDEDPEPPAKWRRYWFQTKSVKDYRPLLFNPDYPWWCVSTAGDNQSVTIVAYLPVEESLKQYWSDAFDVTYTDEKEITFSERFPKPHYYVD